MSSNDLHKGNLLQSGQAVFRIKQFSEQKKASKLDIFLFGTAEF